MHNRDSPPIALVIDAALDMIAISMPQTSCV